MAQYMLFWMQQATKIKIALLFSLGSGCTIFSTLFLLLSHSSLKILIMTWTIWQNQLFDSRWRIYIIWLLQSMSTGVLGMPTACMADGYLHLAYNGSYLGSSYYAHLDQLTLWHSWLTCVWSIVGPQARTAGLVHPKNTYHMLLNTPCVLTSCTRIQTFLHKNPISWLCWQLTGLASLACF